MDFESKRTVLVKLYCLLFALTLFFASSRIVLAETDPVFTDWLTAPYIDINSVAAFVVEQAGVNDDVFIVDTTSTSNGLGQVGINRVPSGFELDIYGSVRATLDGGGLNYFQAVSDDAQANFGVVSKGHFITSQMARF